MSGLLRTAKYLSLLLISLSSMACVNIHSSVKLKVASDKNLNLSDQKDSLPVVLRVYQLSDEGQFQQSHFEDIWKHDREVLGNTLISTHEYTVYPDAVERYVFQKKDNARYIGIAVMFRTPEEYHWRKIVKVPVGVASRSVRILLRDNRLEIE